MSARLQLQRASPWLLVPILGIAAWLRLWRLPDRGLIYWDEGKFCLEGMRLLSGLEVLTGGHAPLSAGKAVGTAKPTHALLIALAYAVLGIHDYSPLILDALCSIAAVGVTYALTRRLFSTGTALLAALLLSVSGYDIVYARSALSENDANLLLLLGVLALTYCWHREDGSWAPTDGRAGLRFLSGLLLGVAFTTNYRTSVYIAVVVVVDLALHLRRRAPLVTPVAAWIGGLALPPLAWEAIGLLVQHHGYVLFRSESTFRPTTYLAEAIYQLHQGPQSVVHFAPLPYLQWLIARQGWPMVLLLAAGLALAAYRRTPNLLLPASLVVFPYAVYVFAPFVVPRNLDTAIPLACIVAATALTFVGERLRAILGAQVILVAAIALAVAATSTLYSWHLASVRSGFARAGTYLQSHHPRVALVTNETMMFYLRESTTTCFALPLPSRVSDLPIAAESGTYAEVDVYDRPSRRYLLNHGHRVARYLAMGTKSLGENLMSSENGFPPGPHQDQHVDVYHFPTLPGRMHVGVHLHVCDLETLPVQ